MPFTQDITYIHNITYLLAFQKYTFFVHVYIANTINTLSFKVHGPASSSSVTLPNTRHTIIKVAPTTRPTNTYSRPIDENIGTSMIRVPADNLYSVFLAVNLFKTIIDKFRQ